MNLRKTLAVVTGLVFLASQASSSAQGPGPMTPVQATGPIYTDGPVYTDDSGFFSSSQGPLWRPYVEQYGSFGDPYAFGSSNLFVPLYQNDQDMLFIDFRGLYGEGGNNLGVFGGGYRRLMDNGLIFGTYGFFDYLNSSLGNEYKAGTIGLELLDEFWDLRVDATIPESVDGEYACNLDVVNNNLVIQHFSEAPYYGGNIELGVLTARSEDEQIEWRNYAGVYAFDNTKTEHEAIYGPRLRSELRLFDVGWLGQQSRVVVGGQVQYDDLQGTQGAGYLSVRIALGRGPELKGMERRMLEPIRRNTYIVTNHTSYSENVKIVGAGGGAIVNGFINSDTVNPEAVFAGAGPNSLVLFSGNGVANGGIIQTALGFVHNEGQTALGAGGIGGGPLFVMGLNSGKMFELDGGFGLRPTVDGTDPGVDVFTLADGGSILGIDIINGRNGVAGDGIEGFTINDVTMSGAAMNGLALTGTNNGDIIDSIAFDNTQNGFYIETYDDGVIRGNLAYDNTEDGYNFGTVGGNALIVGNSSQMGGTGNGDDGFEITLLTGNAIVTDNDGSNNNDNGFEIGTIGGNAILAFNQANGNDADADMDGDGFNIATVGVMGENGLVTGNTATGNYNGFNFTSEITYNALVANNSATGNIADGFLGGDLNEKAIFANNYASGNENGFNFNSINDSALFVSNLAETNTNDGIVFATVAGGSIFENDAVDNMGDGFEFGDVSGGLIAYNTAIMNDANGFNFSGVTSGGIITGNLAGGSMADANGINGFAFADLDGTASILNNEASWNGENGFYSSDADAVALAISGNIANNNQNGSGFQFDGDLTVTNGFASNTANMNNLDGVHVDGSLVADILLNETLNNVNGDGIFVGGDVGMAAVNGDIVGNNASNNALGSGIHVGGTVQGSIVNNTLNMNATDGSLAVVFPDPKLASGLWVEGDVEGDVAYNTANDNTFGDGLHVDGSVNGAFGVVANTTMNNDPGIYIGENITVGDLALNVSSMNAGDGILIGGFIGGSILDNTVMGNLEDGIDVGDNLTSTDTAVFGSIADNTMVTMNGDGTDLEMNGENGIEVTGIVAGNIVGNILNGQTNGNGMFIDGSVEGEISSNEFSNNFLDGLYISGDVMGDIATNTANMNGEDGIDIDGQAFANILGNTTMMNGDGDPAPGVGGIPPGGLDGNGENGFEVGIFNNDVMGTEQVFAENISSDNIYGSGFVFGTFGGGMGDTIFRHNTATGNGVGDMGMDSFGDGLTLTNLAGGIIGDGNVLSMNGRDGLRIDGEMSGGVIYQNMFDLNGEDGLHIVLMSGGLVGADSTLNTLLGTHSPPLNLDLQEFGNVALTNGQHGFYIETITGGTVSQNTAEFNVVDGFHFNLVDMASGSIRFNDSDTNGSDGYEIEEFRRGLVTNNDAFSNGDGSDEGHGFNILMMTSIGGTANLRNNNADFNYLNGIFIGDTNGDGTGSATGIIFNNSADNNGTGGVMDNGNGILIEANFFGTIVDNDADFNAENGIWVRGNLDDNDPMNILDVLDGNDTTNNGLFGIRVDGDVTGNIVSNNSDSNMNGSGIAIFGNVTGDIAFNDADSNMGSAIDGAGYGIRVQGNVTGNINNNGIIQFNEQDGIYVTGNVTGNISDNRVGDNEDGIDIDGTVTGNISGNYVFDNRDNGLELNIVNGNISGNQAGSGTVPGLGATIQPGNDGYGILVFGLVTGDVTGNTTNGNGIDGINLDQVNGTVSNNVTNSNMRDGLSIDDMLATTMVVFNDSTLNGRYGYFINTFDSGVFDNNDAGVDLNMNGIFNTGDSGNLGDNYHIASMTGGTFSNNDSYFAGNNVNASDGYQFELVDGGTITTNEAVASGQHGFFFSGAVTDATTLIQGNASNLNEGDGFNFVSFGDLATFTLNTARFNEDDGFEFTLVDDGFISSNIAEENVDDGFVFTTIDGSLTRIRLNVATENGDDGFFITNFNDGLFELNEANSNVDAGYNAPASPLAPPPSYGAGNGGDMMNGNNQTRN